MITLTDMFCGCGGSSQGARKVGGVQVKLALNHWKLAVESHNTNHPDTDHDCADIQETHAARYGRTTGLIASPECTNHSLAKGKRRKNLAQSELFQSKMIDLSAERSRATMWDVVRFTEQHRYEFIITENVVDVREWELWTPWLQSMHALGYKHKCVYLNAMFAHGEAITGFAPQSRDRIYIVFWKKGNPAPDLDIRPQAPCPTCCMAVGAVQTWKNGRTSGKYKTQYVYRCPGCGTQVQPFYYAALNCLDLSLPMVRIGDREQLGMKPLAPKTIARIEYGLQKFGLQPTALDLRNSSGSEKARIRPVASEVLNAQSTGYSSYLFAPFLFDMAHSTGSHNGHMRGVRQVLNTQTTQMSGGFITPFTVSVNAYDVKDNVRSVTSTLPTQITTGKDGVVVPPGFIADMHGTGKAKSFTDAAGCVATGRNHGLLLPPAAMLTMRGGRSLSSLTEPLATQVAAGIQNWVVGATPFLTPYHGGGHQAALTTEPASTIPTNDSLALVEAWQQPKVEDCYFRMLQPAETALAQGFPTDYIILGNKSEQQKQIGNANPPPTMELLVQRCVASLEGQGRG